MKKGVGAAITGGAGSPGTLSLAGLTAGRGLVLILFMQTANGTAPAITTATIGTDSLIPIGTTAVGGSGVDQWSVQLAYISAMAVSGAQTLTFNFTSDGSLGAANWVATAWEVYDDVTGAIALDGSNKAAGSTANPTFNVTTSVLNSLVLGGYDFVGGAGPTSNGAGYSDLSSTSFFNFEDTQYNIAVGAAGAIPFGYTAVAQDWVGAAAGFKAAGSTTLVPTVNDAITTSESTPINLLLQPNLFNSIAVAELINITLPLLLSLHDGIGVNDTIFIGSADLVLISNQDTVSVTESITALLPRLPVSVNDAITVAESVTITYAQNTVAPAVFDSVGVSEAISLSSFQGLYLTANDSVGVNRGAAQVSWTADTDPDLAGYKLYYGTSSGVYGTPIDVGNVTSYTVLNLDFGTTYYFAVTAYDTSNNKSGFSTEVSVTPTDILLGAVVILMRITTNDAVSIVDAVSAGKVLFVNVFDTVTNQEVVTVRFPFIAVNKNDAISVADAPTLIFVALAGLSIAVNDTVTLAESITTAIVTTGTYFDVVTLTELAYPMLMSYPNKNDAITVAESITVQVLLSSLLSLSDTVTITDVITVRMNRILLNVSDSVPIGDGVGGQPPNIGGRLRGKLTSIAGTSPASVIT